MTPAPMKWPRALPMLVTIGVLLVIAGVFFHGLALAYESLRAVLLPLLFSLAIAYLLEPVVDRLVRKKIPRHTAAILTVAGATVLLLLAAGLAAPAIGAQLVESAQKIPQAVTNILTGLKPSIEHLREVSPKAYDWMLAKINDAVQHPSALTEPVIGSLQSAFTQFAHATSGLLDVVLIPFFVFYFLSEGREWRRRMVELVPLRRQAAVVDFLNHLDGVASNFVRGQLSVCGVMALLYAFGFAVIGTPLPFALGIISGFAHLIPYVGTFSAAILTLALTGLESPGWVRLAFVVATYVGVQSLEGFVLTPRILGERLQLHPFVVIVGILVGGSLFGMAGIILATPAVAIVKVLLRLATASYKQSSFYGGEKSPAASVGGN